MESKHFEEIVKLRNEKEMAINAIKKCFERVPPTFFEVNFKGKENVLNKNREWAIKNFKNFELFIGELKYDRSKVKFFEWK